MRLLSLILLIAPAFGQAPTSITNPFTNGVTQPTVTTPTVGGGGIIQSPITIAAGLACTVAPTVTIFSSNGAGSGATATATCTNSLVDTTLTVTAGGTLYTQGQVFLIFSKGLWGYSDDHAHSVPTGGNSPACKTACAFACSGYKAMGLIEKLQNTAYTQTDPGASCRTVISGYGSCPVYLATTWAVSTVTSGNPTHMQVTTNPDALYAVLSTDNSTPTPILVAGTSSGLTVTPTIDGGGAGNITSLINTANFPWYVKNVVTVAGVSTDFDLYYWKTTNGVGNFNTAVATTGTPGGSPTVQLNGCGSVDTGTNGNAVITFQGYEQTASDNHALFAQIGWMSQVTSTGAHHGTAMNVAGAPVATISNDWYANAKWALDNPTSGSGAASAFTFAHATFNTAVTGAGWSPQQLSYLGQLVAQYPGQIHLQVFDYQTTGYADGAWDWMLSNSNSPIWGNASGDSYNLTIQASSGIKGGGMVANVDSWTIPELMNSVNNGRTYFWRNAGSGGAVSSALRCGVLTTKIVCRTLLSEAAISTVSNRVYMWIGEGGKILRVSGSVNQDAYTVTGKEGRYVRLMTLDNGSPTNTYAGAVVYVAGQYIDTKYYSGGATGTNGAGALNSIVWSQPFWISYGGTAGSSSAMVSR